MASLKNLICEQFGLVEGSVDALKLYSYSVAYMIKGMGAFSYQAEIKPYCKQRALSAKSFRLSLQGSGYTIGLKLYVLALMRKGNCNITTAIDCAEKAGIHREDAELIYWMLKELPWFLTMAQTLANAIPVGHAHETLEGVQASFAAVYSSVYKFVKYVTYKKLRFLCDSTNTALADFHADLMEKAARSLYLLAPTRQPEAYIKNYLKRAIRNAATNIIKSGTTKKRARQVDLGFDKNGMRSSMLLCLSQNQMTPMIDADGQVMMPDEGDTGSSMRKFELQFSISEVLNRYKKTSRKYRLLLILLGGEEDQEFTAYLRARDLCPMTKDHCDIQVEIEHSEYNKLVSEFLHVSYKKVEEFLQSLRSELEVIV
jgi:hypothetical protein